MEQNLPSRTVTLVHNGKNYQGTYTVDGSYLTVLFGMATKTTQIDPFHDTLEVYAKLLLSEMVEAEKKDF